MKVKKPPLDNLTQRLDFEGERQDQYIQECSA